MSLKFIKLVFCVLFLSIGMVGFTIEAAAEDEDHGISITSTSHEIVTYTHDKVGVLDIYIASRSSIMKVLVNGISEFIPTHVVTTMGVNHNYELQPGKNEFEIFVQTGLGSHQNTFVIHLTEEPTTSASA